MIRQLVNKRWLVVGPNFWKVFPGEASARRKHKKLFPGKNFGAVALGRRGGKKGGLARWLAELTPEQRSALQQKGLEAARLAKQRMAEEKTEVKA